MATLTRLPELLQETYHGPERLTRDELQRRSGELDLAPKLRRLVDALPDGEYDRDQAGAVLERVQREEGMWRDEEQVSLADLERAMATSASEGQADDPTGHEAGPAATFGDQTTPSTDRRGEPDPESPAGRRPSPDPPAGPH